MKRRDVFRSSIAVLSVSTVTSLSGCLGLFGSDSGSDAPRPVSDPRESEDEDLPEAVEESVEDIADSQVEIDAAIRGIESDINSFDGLVDNGESPPTFDHERIREHSQNAQDHLESAHNGATEGQEILITELESVIEGFKSFADVLEKMESAVEAFTNIEKSIRDVDTDRIGPAVNDFGTHLEMARENLATAQVSFENVSEAVLEEADQLTPGRINSVFVKLRDANSYMDLVEDTVENLQSVVPLISDTVSAVEREDFSHVLSLLPDVHDHFDEAYMTVEGMEGSTAVAYRQDVQALECATVNTRDAVEELQDAVEAHQSGDAIAAVGHYMDGHDLLTDCRYRLFDDVYESMGQDLI